MPDQTVEIARAVWLRQRGDGQSAGAWIVLGVGGDDLLAAQSQPCQFRVAQIGQPRHRGRAHVREQHASQVTLIDIRALR